MGGEYHAKVLELMLQPWCYSISTHANDENYNLFSGKAITQLARLLPEQFRTEVGKLPEDMKTILQGVMRRALQESAADNSSTAGTQPALKLNVEKFRSSGK